MARKRSSSSFCSPGSESAVRAGVAVGGATEDEGVVLVEDEGFAFHGAVGELEVNFAGHGWRV